MKRYLSNKWTIISFIAPALLLFGIFVFYPLIQVFVYSFTEWDGVNKAVFTGFDNYIKLFKTSTFKVANLNGLKFGAVITVYQLVLATIFAIAVSDKRIRGRKFFRTAYFIPVVLSVTVVCQLWTSIFDANGLVNVIAKSLGLEPQNWLGKRYEAIYAIAFVNAWQWMGFNVRAWDVQDEEVMCSVCECLADGMTVNFPDKLTEYLQLRYRTLSLHGNTRNRKNIPLSHVSFCSEGLSQTHGVRSEGRSSCSSVLQAQRVCRYILNKRSA